MRENDITSESLTQLSITRFKAYASNQ